ncbi:PAS domain-containing protein [Azospirillum sp.]|uniref:PAS domain-containing protein n=1 Tax=Azospirillum sp. TaxID=34012 RepID=UPI003D71F28F
MVTADGTGDGMDGSALRLLLERPERAPAGLALIAAKDFRPVYTSAAYHRIMGKLPPAHAAQRQALLERSVSTGQPVRLNGHGGAPGLRVRGGWLDIEHAPLPGDHGVRLVLELVATAAQDERPPSMAAVYASDGTCAYRSPVYASLTGVDHGGGDPVPSRAVHPEDRGRVEEGWRRSRLMNTPFLARYRLMTAHGHLHWFAERAEPVYEDHTRTIRWYGVLIDAEPPAAG